MIFCHGNGNLANEGCCWVNGTICPLQWKIVGGRIYQGPGRTDIGTVADFAASVSNNPNVRKRITDQAEGITFACSAAINALIADPSLLNNRVGFEAAWAARPEYQVIADAWEAIGKPRNWCPTFGPAEVQCCYAEDEATNVSKRSALTSSAVTIRQGRSL